MGSPRVGPVGAWAKEAFCMPKPAPGMGTSDPHPQARSVAHQVWGCHAGGCPPKVYETVQALGYHHLGDLYTPDHQILWERALKERVPPIKESQASACGSPATAPS